MGRLGSINRPAHQWAPRMIGVCVEFEQISHLRSDTMRVLRRIAGAEKAGRISCADAERLSKRAVSSPAQALHGMFECMAARKAAKKAAKERALHSALRRHRRGARQ